MLEWLKRHAWKACSRLKRLTGSNPVLSAKAETIGEPNLFERNRWSLLFATKDAKDAKRTKRSLMITVVRESISRVKMFIDFLTGKEPKFLGEKIVV